MSCSVCLRVILQRLRLGLARRKRLAFGLMSDSLCVSVFAVFFVLYVYLMSSDCRYVCECSTHQIALLCSLCTHTADYVYGSPRCFARFISSCMIRGAPIYPRFPCVTRSPCDGVGHGTSRLLLSWVAQRVKDVFHVAGLPHSCMTSC